MITKSIINSIVLMTVQTSVVMTVQTSVLMTVQTSVLMTVQTSVLMTVQTSVLMTVQTSVLMTVQTNVLRLQTTQPTSGGAVTADKNCCANCVEPSRPQQWGPDLPFIGHAGHADPLDGWRCCSELAGNVETNPGPTTVNKRVWMCDICHKQIHVRKQISIRFNRIEHWVQLRCSVIRQAEYI